MDVLLVDDDARIRQVLSRLLKSTGTMTIHEASDGEEALDTLLNIQAQLILTDYHMPRMDGISFVRALRARGDQTPVIMVSGHSESHDIVLAIRAGVDNYLPKPINPEVLFERIGQTLGARKVLS